MNSDQHHLAKELFLSIIAAAPKDIQSYLASQTSDQTVINEVLALLGTHQCHTNNTEDFVTEVKDNIASSAMVFPTDRYELIEKIGQGGMGDVYLAQRKNKAVQQYVAIKILHKSDHMSEKRFMQEMRILSKLSHQNISQFIDADYLANGRPYVVMEYTQGQRITDYCQRKKLSINARIALFIKLCQAVQHAHRRLVIHRDIKPDNVLVNENGQLKLLDFGIAKVIEDSNYHKTQTEMGVMTPAYASPEQLFGHKIGTTSDVYSLGVLLYELLTGVRPYQGQYNSPVAYAKTLENQEIDKPSAKLTQLNHDKKTVLKTRNLNRWIRRVSGDLDKIVLKALQFDTSQRYFTVMELIDDLNRYRRKRPVLAQNPSLYYVMNKFVVRNSLYITLFLMLLGFSFYTFKQKLRLDDVSRDLQVTNKEITKQRDLAIRERKTMKNLANNLVEVYYPDPLNVGKQNLIINDSINIATGYLYYEEVLAELNEKFHLRIFYNSNYALHTRAWSRILERSSEYREPLIKYALGRGWNHNFSKEIIFNWIDVRKTVFVYRDDDRLIEFVKKGDQWINRYNTEEKLRVEPITTYSEKLYVTNQYNAEESYRGRKLMSIHDETQTINLSYKRYIQLEEVKSTMGDKIQFHYNDMDEIQVVKVNINDDIWQFEYDLYDNLVQIVYPDGSNKSFSYITNKHLLSGVGQQQFNRIVNHTSYKYDPFHRVYKIIYNDGDCAKQELTIVYHNDMTRTVTNSQGQVNYYKIEQFDGIWKIVEKDIQYDYQKCLPLPN